MNIEEEKYNFHVGIFKKISELEYQLQQTKQQLQTKDQALIEATKQLDNLNKQLGDKKDKVL